MIRRLCLFCTGLFLFCCWVPSAQAIEFPERPDGYVTDKVDLLSPETVIRLNRLLAGFERHTSNQIFIAIFPSLEGDNLEEASIRLAEKWKPGQKGKDNGVIFLIFQKEKKMRIEVGYGLEAVLPDAFVGNVIQQIVTGHFREGRYDEGVLLGVGSLMKSIGDEHQPGSGILPAMRELTPAEREAMEKRNQTIFGFVLLILLIFFIVDYIRYARYRHEHRIYKKRYGFWEWWFRFAILLFVLSMLFRIMFYMALFSRGGYYGGRSGFGGFSGGRGGGFGGGGASGGW